MTEEPPETASSHSTDSPSADGASADGASSDRPHGISRRGLVGGGFVAGVGALAGAGIATAAAADRNGAATADEVDLSGTVPFYATRSQQLQWGVSVEPQRHTVVMALDLTIADPRSLQVLLARWSAAIAQLQAGRTIGSVESKVGVGVDTGEALDLGPASLTVILGLGPGIFDDRFGLADKKPSTFGPLPTVAGDAALRKELCDGDIVLQACADDPQVAYHAVRDLARMARDSASVRWTVLGFGRASAGAHQTTPRNLLGFKDGTRNITESSDIEDFVRLRKSTDGGADWMAGGTYMVTRKIEMNIEIWDADPVNDQQHIFGRHKVSGAPLSGGEEHTTPDFTKKAADGSTKIDPRSHVALAAPENNQGIKILRRGYNFTDGLNEYGQLDAGLMFIAFMNDLGHFVTLQNQLGSLDLLNEYISHVGSAVFAVPPAPLKGHYIGQALFD